MITLLNKFDDNYVMKKEDVLEIASKYIREHGIEPYLKDVFFTAHNDSIAAYDFTAHRMILNTEVIKKACELSYRELKEKGSSLFSINIGNKAEEEKQDKNLEFSLFTC